LFLLQLSNLANVTAKTNFTISSPATGLLTEFYDSLGFLVFSDATTLYVVEATTLAFVSSMNVSAQYLSLAHISAICGDGTRGLIFTTPQENGLLQPFTIDSLGKLAAQTALTYSNNLLANFVSLVCDNSTKTVWAAAACPGPYSPADVVEIEVSESESTNWSVKQTTNWGNGVCFASGFVDPVTHGLWLYDSVSFAAYFTSSTNTSFNSLGYIPLDAYAAGFGFDPAHHLALFLEPQNGYAAVYSLLTQPATLQYTLPLGLPAGWQSTDLLRLGASYWDPSSNVVYAVLNIKQLSTNGNALYAWNIASSSTSSSASSSSASASSASSASSSAGSLLPPFVELWA